MNQQKNFNEKEFSQDVERLLYEIGQNANDDHGLFEMRVDLLGLMFREYIATEWFKNIEPYRKKEQFEQYEILCQLLQNLENFADKYPGHISSIEARVEYEPILNVA